MWQEESEREDNDGCLLHQHNVQTDKVWEDLVPKSTQGDLSLVLGEWSETTCNFHYITMMKTSALTHQES